MFDETLRWFRNQVFTILMSITPNGDYVPIAVVHSLTLLVYDLDTVFDKGSITLDNDLRVNTYSCIIIKNYLILE